MGATNPEKGIDETCRAVPQAPITNAIVAIIQKKNCSLIYLQGGFRTWNYGILHTSIPSFNQAIKKTNCFSCFDKLMESELELLFYQQNQ